MNYYPQVYVIVLPTFLGYGMAFMVELSTTYIPYYVHDSCPSLVSATFLLIIFIPTQWKSSSLVVISGWAYYVYQVYMRHNLMTPEVIVNAVSSSFYFVLSAYILNSKFKELMHHSFKTEKHARETTKLIEIFPHGVIIQAKENEESDGSVYTNKEFKKQIQNIRNRVNELKNIKVSYETSDSNQGQAANTDLHQYLQLQQRKLRDEIMLEQRKLVIECITDMEAETGSSEPESDTTERIFNIKSMQVEWQGRPSFMHVFIDTTDIIKLEEAIKTSGARRSCLPA